MTISISVNGSSIKIPEGSSVLDAVNASGTYIPQLCKDPDMKQIGACRTCLVNVEGVNGFPASCSLPALDGMEVNTATDDVVNLRRSVLDLTLGMIPKNDADEPNDLKELRIAAEKHGLSSSSWEHRDRESTDSSNPVFEIAMDSCILCQRCVQACQDGHQFIGAIEMLGAGTSGRIGTFMDKPLIDSVCTTCGQCLSVCPTGAISLKEGSPDVLKTTKSTCPYCGVGCGIQTQVDERDHIVSVLDDPENQSSLGMLCVKGRFGLGFVNHDDRLKTPLIRKNGELKPAEWDEAIDYVARRLSEFRGDSFATLCSAKATNEDGYA